MDLFVPVGFGYETRAPARCRPARGGIVFNFWREYSPASARRVLTQAMQGLNG